VTTRRTNSGRVIRTNYTLNFYFSVPSTSNTIFEPVHFDMAGTRFDVTNPAAWQHVSDINNVIDWVDFRMPNLDASRALFQPPAGSQCTVVNRFPTNVQWPDSNTVVPAPAPGSMSAPLLPPAFNAQIEVKFFEPNNPNEPYSETAGNYYFSMPINGPAYRSERWEPSVDDVYFPTDNVGDIYNCTRTRKPDHAACLCSLSVCVCASFCAV
jgi:hypothetical protein